MHDDRQYDNAMNCANAYWEHPIDDGQPNQPQREMSRRTERVICRLMTQAIYFANAWSEAVRDNAKDNNGQDEDIKGIMRCTIVDVYKDILWIYGCEGRWGTYYAWYVVDQISAGLTAHGGDQHCRKGKYKDIDLRLWPMRNQMKTWLQQNARMQEKLEQEQISAGCTGGTVHLEVPRKQEERDDKNDRPTKHEVKHKVTTILETLQIHMKNEETQLSGSTDPAPTYPSGAQAHDTKDAAIENEMQQAIAHVKEELDAVIVHPASAKPGGNSKPAAAHPATTKPAEGAGAGDQKGQKPAAPSPSPSPGSTGQGSTRGGPRSDTTAGEGVQVSQPTLPGSQPQAPVSPVPSSTPVPSSAPSPSAPKAAGSGTSGGPTAPDGNTRADTTEEEFDVVVILRFLGVRTESQCEGV
ncbi:hypothetical protein AK88_05356 [Plasmodium fragile]|uniref:Schizont-infected cell agglutination extracellular alpha domain-containing protein n=1 Tax=Plasmodium fragile TaxID=5857 RepID=A0A0D9QDF9_PLAFR|nr:uncharacterized protein AK88_05356 [Plasmodium fragile]KJP85014.1 hypothetical protein AK88_05356 [Plasmodium fragile]